MAIKHSGRLLRSDWDDRVSLRPKNRSYDRILERRIATAKPCKQRAGEIASPLFLRTVSRIRVPAPHLYSGSVGSLNNTVSLMLP